MLIEGKKIQIECSVRDQKFSKCILRTLDSKYEEMDSDFHFLDKDERYRYHVDVFKDLSDLNQVVGENFDSFEMLRVNYVIRRNSRLYILSPDEVKHITEEEYKKSILHEFVIAVFKNEIGRYKTQTFLEEGIANVYARQFNLNNLDTLIYPKVSDILGVSENYEKPDSFVFNSGNEYSSPYAWYIIMKYGFNGFIEAYKGITDVKEMIFKNFEKEAIEKFKHNYSKK